jgi:hypothetical protein
MKSLKSLTKKLSFDVIFNSIYRNFLKHDFSRSDISEISIIFLDKYDQIKNCEEILVDECDKLLVSRGIEGLFQLGTFNTESKEIERTEFDVEYLCHLHIINKHKLSETNLVSFVFWELFKFDINCEETK